MIIAFAVLALLILFGALQVIRTQDLVHAVLWLTLTLLSTAGCFVVLQADFVAAIQVLLYTGGVITLMLFAVMLTGHLKGSVIRIKSRGWLRAIPVPIALVSLVTWGILSSDLPEGGMLPHGDARALGELFLTRQMASFELLSVLLLAAVIGAIALARKKDAQ